MVSPTGGGGGGGTPPPPPPIPSKRAKGHNCAEGHDGVDGKGPKESAKLGTGGGGGTLKPDNASGGSGCGTNMSREVGGLSKLKDRGDGPCPSSVQRAGSDGSDPPVLAHANDI